jgi:hypothetical protein
MFTASKDAVMSVEASAYNPSNWITSWHSAFSGRKLGKQGSGVFRKSQGTGACLDSAINNPPHRHDL